jgi:hypothetical protein
MKKLILILGLSLPLFAFNGEKKYTLTFNEQELQAVWYCIDQSSAPHVTVKQVQELINKQLAAQLDTTIKK